MMFPKFDSTSPCPTSLRPYFAISCHILCEITGDNVVEVEIQDTSSLDIIASSETVVHREIYRKTSALAIIHAHCSYAVVESLLAGAGEVIVPVDSEGQYFLGNIPVVGGGIGSRELAENLADTPALEAENSGLLSATSLDTLSGPDGVSERASLSAAFSGNYRFLVEVRTGDGKGHWQIAPDNAEPEYFANGMEKVAASVPVVIELNPAESVQGILTVVIYKTEWN